MAYFGLDTTAGDVTRIKITELSYAPIVEDFEPDVTPLGVEPQFLTVSVAVIPPLSVVLFEDNLRSTYSKVV